MNVTATGSAVETACQALLTYSSRFADILQRVDDPAAQAVGVWSIAETAVHVSQSSPYFLAAAGGQGELENLNDNAATTVAAVAAEPERDLGVLAGRILQGEQNLVAYARAADGDPAVTPFAGLSVPLSSMLGIELGELLVHGFDVTRAAGLAWPVEPADAALALSGELRVLPLLLDTRRAAGLRMRLKLHIRYGSPLVVVIENGALHVEPPSARPVDCHVLVDPVAFLLISFHRISPLTAALSGKIIAWGRKPWLLPKFQSALKGV